MNGAAVREFTTAVKAAVVKDTENEGVTKFKIDGRECTAYRPEDGQLALLMATTASHSNMHEKVAGIINFFIAVLEERDHYYVTGRLLDREDDFGIEDVTAIMEHLIEEWSGNPTESPSDSSPSPRSGGQKSSRRTTAATSSV